MTTTETIKGWLDHADASEVEVEALRWRAAEALFEANRGEYAKRQKELAAEINRSQATVSKYIKCWVQYGPTKLGEKPRKPWAEAWRWATSKETKAGRSKTKGTDSNSDSPGNKPKKPRPDPEWEAVAGEFKAACSLMQNDPELLAVVAPDEQSGDIRKHAEHFIHWSTPFVKALDARFENDDPEFD